MFTLSRPSSPQLNQRRLRGPLTCRYVVFRGAGLNVIFAPGLEHLHDEDLGRRWLRPDEPAALPRGEHPGGPQPTRSSWVNDSPRAPARGYALLFRPRLRPPVHRRCISVVATDAARTLISSTT